MIDTVIATYDALGRMVEQNKSGVFTEIAYAPGGGKLALMTGQTLQRAFVPLTGGSMAIYNSTGLSYYRHSDWVGSSRFASTPVRTMFSDGAYGPFGEPYAQTGSTDVSFTGMNQDTVSNLYDFAAREYGTQGRWPSPDPAGSSVVDPTDPRTWNRYVYARNNPLGAVDPSGLVDRSPSLGMALNFYGLMSGGGGGGFGCNIDGLTASCQMALGALQSGAGVQCPNNECGIGSATPFQCVDSVCGYMSDQYVASHENEVNGQLLTNSQYQTYLATENPAQVSAQYNRIMGNLAALFGDLASADPENPDIEGGHANFAYTCTDWSTCGPGRYDDGIHIECAMSGCSEGDPLVVHDDTVSPWTGSFSFSAVGTANFWEHGFVDLIGGQLCNCVFPY